MRASGCGYNGTGGIAGTQPALARRSRQWRIGLKSAGVPLYCGEFGVYRQYSPTRRCATPGSATCERRSNPSTSAGRCGTTKGGFGIVTKGGSGTVVDQGVAAALGLKK